MRRSDPLRGLAQFPSFTSPQEASSGARPPQVTFRGLIQSPAANGAAHGSGPPSENHGPQVQHDPLRPVEAHSCARQPDLRYATPDSFGSSASRPEPKPLSNTPSSESQSEHASHVPELHLRGVNGAGGIPQPPGARVPARHGADQSGEDRTNTTSASPPYRPLVVGCHLAGEDRSTVESEQGDAASESELPAAEQLRILREQNEQLRAALAAEREENDRRAAMQPSPPSLKVEKKSEARTTAVEGDVRKVPAEASALLQHQMARPTTAPDAFERLIQAAERARARGEYSSLSVPILSLTTTI